jgi:hypothetical protein
MKTLQTQDKLEQIWCLPTAQKPIDVQTIPFKM